MTLKTSLTDRPLHLRSNTVHIRVLKKLPNRGGRLYRFVLVGNPSTPQTDIAETPEYRYLRGKILKIRFLQKFQTRSNRPCWFSLQVLLRVDWSPSSVLNIEQDVSGEMVYQMLDQLGESTQSELHGGILRCQGKRCVVCLDQHKRITGIFEPDQFSADERDRDDRDTPASVQRAERHRASPSTARIRARVVSVVSLKRKKDPHPPAKRKTNAGSNTPKKRGRRASRPPQPTQKGEKPKPRKGGITWRSQRQRQKPQHSVTHSSPKR